MQVIGVSVTDDAIMSIARRGSREVVVEWAERVLKRHVRREQTLMVRIAKRSTLDAAMKADALSPAVMERITAAFVAKEPIYTGSKTAMAAFMQRAADTMDWIESLPENDRRIKRIQFMAWSDAEKLAEAWHISVNKARKASKNIMEGVKKLSDLDGGAFVAELTTAAALKAEGHAMGHCVGGYWSRVERGDTKIVSIRDEDGQPHVTIELNGAPIVKFEDGTEMVASHAPSRGVSILTEAKNHWVAVQVRGKSNKVPVERYLRHVAHWLTDNDIPWVEYGSRLSNALDGPGVTVYTVFGRSFLSQELSVAYGEEKLRNELTKKNADFRKLYEGSGLAAIHKLSDKKRVGEFLANNIPELVGSFTRHLSKGMSFPISMKISGMSLVLDNIADDGSTGIAARRQVFDATINIDVKETTVSEQVLVEVPGGKDLRMVVHSLPLMPLFILTAGYGNGFEQKVVEMIRPHLEKTAKRICGDPSAVHVIRAGTGAVTAEDIRKAFLFCGLAAEYQAAVTAVTNIFPGLVSEAKVFVKRARAAGKIAPESLNRVNNLLADGYEKRLLDRVTERVIGGALILSTRPQQKAVTMSRQVYSLGM